MSAFTMDSKRDCTRTAAGLGAFVILSALLGCPAVPRDAPVPAHLESVKEEMQTMMDFLDSPPYEAAVLWEEHVVLCYFLAQGRQPTPSEFVCINGLHEDIGLKRSEALSFALAGSMPRPTWAVCRDFVDRASPTDFRVTQAVRSTVAQLDAAAPDAVDAFLKTEFENLEKAATEWREPFLYDLDPPGTEYNTYFGYLHAHCELSDGEGTADEAYAHARDVGGLDFFALTDHGELLMLWPWDNKWQELVAAAEAANAPGEYVAFWGFEWSNPVLGHINVINSDDFTQCISTFRLRKLYRWVEARPASFACFNHPGTYDFLRIQFMHFLPFEPVAQQMVGIELWNKDSGFDEYYYCGSWRSDMSYWDVANLKGWRLGALGAQDNHDRTWGSRNEFRTAVLALELTREALHDAYLKRRFYATEDKDLFLDFTCQGYPVGAQLEGVAREFVVTAEDGSGDQFSEVRLLRNGTVIETQAVSGASFTATFSDGEASADDYYYVIVTQTDDNDANGRNDEAISSPIWVRPAAGHAERPA